MYTVMSKIFCKCWFTFISKIFEFFFFFVLPCLTENYFASVHVTDIQSNYVP